MPEQKIVVLEKTYWACHVDKHRHTTKEIAEKCENNNKAGHSYPRWTDEKIGEILVSRLINKQKWKVIAKEFDRSACTVTAKCWKGIRMLRRGHTLGISSEQLEQLQAFI
jgi:hypothetical protein